MDNFERNISKTDLELDGVKRSLKELNSLSNIFARSMTKGFKSAVVDGQSFERVLKNIALSLSKSVLKVGLKPLENMLSGAFSNLLGGLGNILPFAKGGAVGGGNGGILPFTKGGVVSAPSFFPIGNGMGVAGEAGAEAIIPLARSLDGRLGVRLADSAPPAQPIMVTINTPDVESFRRSEGQLTAALTRSPAWPAQPLEIASEKRTQHMAGFHELRFPIEIAFGATGGPSRKTEIVTMASGQEARNARWAHSKRSFNAGTGIKTLDQLQQVISFFEARRGALHGFRFRDPMDCKSSSASLPISTDDQVIGTGDGVQTAFPLVKVYGDGEDAYFRPIQKPVAETAVFSVGETVVLSSELNLDSTTGIVTFSDPPGLGVSVKAGFEFDVPVRFETDSLAINLAKFAAGDIPTVPLVEIRL